MSAILVANNTVTGAAPPNRRRGGGVWRAVRGNRKAMVGVALSTLFILLAAVPHLFVPWQHGDPQAVGETPLLHPSLHHWLGTTGLGQDVYAELVYSTRNSLLIAVLAGLGATVLSVLI